MRKSLLAAVVAVATGWAGQASAADLIEPFVPPPPPPIFTWSGFYIGGHVGFGEASFAGHFHPTTVAPGERPSRFFSRLDPDGIVGGLQAGYNWQMNVFVLGLEGDVSFTDWRARLTDGHGNRISADVNMLASVRGRLGMAFDRIHVYGTGGLAFSDARARAFDFDTATRGSVSFSDVGWVVGGGAEFMITDNFSLRGEGLFYMFDESRRLRGIGGHPRQAPGGNDFARFKDAWVIRAGANFHF